MTNNDILRRLRYALGLGNATIIDHFNKGGHALSLQDLDLLLKKDDEQGFVNCPDVLLAAFLDGLIISRRGPSDHGTDVSEPLNNNLILRKLRIALELKDTEMLRILLAGGLDVSKAELSALFRKPDHRNYKPCRDQLLKKFLAGLSTLSREELT